MHLLRVRLEAVVRHDQERGAVLHPAIPNGIHHFFDAAIQEGDGGCGCRSFWPIRVVHGIEREEVHQQQIGLVFAHQVGRGLGPDLIAEKNIGLRKILHIGSRNGALAQHLADQRVFRRSPFGKGPSDRRRVIDRHPIHLRRRQPGAMRGIVDGGHVHHLFLVHPRIDFDGRPPSRGHDGSVDQQAMLIGANSGNKRGVVRPRDGRVDRLHARRDAIADQAAQRRHGEFGVVQGEGGESVKADHDHHALLRPHLRHGWYAKGAD